MNVIFTPSGGRFGFGFDYYCTECGAYLGNSTEDKRLVHRATVKKGIWFMKKSVPCKCSHAGEIFVMPIHEIIVTQYN